jgi:hypothetical protein
MTDSPTCPTCDEPICLDDCVYFWPDRQTMEHLRCRARRDLDLRVEELEASADPAYGPMS